MTGALSRKMLVAAMATAFALFLAFSLSAQKAFAADGVDLAADSGSLISAQATIDLSEANQSDDLDLSSMYAWWDGRKNYIPNITVMYKGKALKKGVDYTQDDFMLWLGGDAELIDNPTAVQSVNKPGWYCVPISGKGSYSGDTVMIVIVEKITVSVKAQKFAGKTLRPVPTVKVVDGMGQSMNLYCASGPTKDDEFGTDEDVADFKISYKNNTKAGTASMTITGIGDYAGNGNVITKTFKIAKGINPMKVKVASPTIKYAKVKQAKRTVKPISFTKKAAGAVTYANASSKLVSKYFSVNKKTGQITAKKGTPKKTYTVKVKITAAGNANYNKMVKTVTVKVKVS